jgi:hypothetical protein
MNDLRYPIGKFTKPRTLLPDARAAAIAAIAALPSRFSEAVRGLDQAQLDTRYRDGGWTVRQVVHHVADSHVNAYIRCKMLLTEDVPTVKPFAEEPWAELDDGRVGPVGISLLLLAAVHERWVHCLRTTPAASFQRTLQHPESGEMTLDDMVGLYDWHGRHHLAHVTTLRRSKGW